MAAYVQDVFMAFGDSITQGAWEPGVNGFGERLSHVYARKLDVLNRGLSGYNTEWAIPIFEHFFATQHEQRHVPKVKILTVWFGANDACLKPSPQHVPLPQFVTNLKTIVNMVHDPQSPFYSPDTKIILITPPPVNTHERGANLASRDPPQALDRKFDVTRSYADAVKGVAAELDLPVVDVWTTLWKAAGEDEHGLSKYLADGLHLNEAGYHLMYDALMEVIALKLPELHPDRLEYVFPPWKDVNWTDARSSIKKRVFVLQ
ncbi:SGNH hydrolase [Fistulina hepatica ATCC 64428]|nr:SGNH hydrolase [Fistulina hepatica ATCC 64428]